MRQHRIAFILGVLFLASFAQSFASGGFQADLVGQLEYVQKQILDLENAIPDSKMTWRPTKEVRSVSEVYSHIAFGNYLIAGFAGITVPKGIAASAPGDEKKWEEMTADKKEIKEQLVKSFDFVKGAVKGLSDADLDKMVDFFGNKMSVRSLLMVLLSHTHEHLGQSITYARMVGVVPPWTAAQMEAAKAKK